jgi:hypothetical protein
MKKLLFIIVLSLTFSVTASAQKDKGNILKLHIGVLNKIKLAYEVPVSDVFSFGSTAAYYFGSYPGFKVEPFARFYIGGEAPSGLYLQAKGAYGSFNPELIFFAPNFFSNASAIIEKKSVSSVGGGLDLGYQWLSGKKKNIAIDISLGAQIMKDINSSITKNNITYTSENIGFLTTGPGGLFNPKLSIGYRF